MTSKTKPIGRLIVRVFSWMGLVTVTKKSQDCEIISNLTLINLLLVKFGPMKESSAAKTVMIVQILCSFIGFAIRYGVVHLFYESA
jgi:UDP-N-acetylglucosamine--dolichyl-phosphate N-acetylglucosaminephosphotransferase